MHPRRNPPRPLPSPPTLPPFPRPYYKPRRYQPTLLAATKTPRPGCRNPPPRARHLARVPAPRLRPHAPVRPHARPQRRYPARPRRAALAVTRGLALRRQTGHHCLIPEPGPERRRRNGPSGTADPVFQCRPPRTRSCQTRAGARSGILPTPLVPLLLPRRARLQ